MPPQTRRRLLAGFLLLGLLIVLTILFQSPGWGTREITFTQYLALEDKIRAVTIRGEDVSGLDGAGKRFTTRVPSGVTTANHLAQQGVEVTLESASISWSHPEIVTWLIYFVTTLITFWYYHRIAQALEQPRRPGGDGGR